METRIEASANFTPSLGQAGVGSPKTWPMLQPCPVSTAFRPELISSANLPKREATGDLERMNALGAISGGHRNRVLIQP
jgi:hypothetical protein